MRYRCVDAQEAAGFSVAAACSAAGVTRSAYYAWRTSAQEPSERQREEARLLGEIRRIHTRSAGVYGSPRVHAELGRRGWRVNHKRVERPHAHPRHRRAPAPPAPQPHQARSGRGTRPGPAGPTVRPRPAG